MHLETERSCAKNDFSSSNIGMHLLVKKKKKCFD